MRENLKQARKAAGMTQQELADKLRISLTHYQNIEYGKALGSIKLWDDLEDITGINQRVLRETHPVPLNNQE